MCHAFCTNRWAGVGIAQEEAYRLFLAMTKLRASQGLKSVRFFGKARSL